MGNLPDMAAATAGSKIINPMDPEGTTLQSLDRRPLEALQDAHPVIIPTSDCDQVPPCLKERKIRGLDIYTRWYHSTSSHEISQPPRFWGPKHDADLFIHSVHSIGMGDINSTNSGTTRQIWMYEGGVWMPDIEEGSPHPRLPAHCLRLLKGGIPSWVTRRSQTTYKSRYRSKISKGPAV